MPAVEPGEHRPTIRDVADLAGVSRSTTARALRGTGYVAESVRLRVLDAADEIGYVANAVASSLRSRESRSIGVLVSDLRDPFYSELAAGAAHRARTSGRTMVLIDDRGSPEGELEAAAALVGLRVAGIVLTPLSAAASEYLVRQRMPHVEADRTFSDPEDRSVGGEPVDTVLVDNIGATSRLIELLVALGHRRIAMLADETGWTTGAARLLGYRSTLEAAGIQSDPGLVRNAGTDVESARRAAVEALTRADSPTAVFCANSVIAEGLWRACADLGLRVPDDLSIVSFDDAPWMSLVRPGITTIAQDAEGLGEAAMEQLFARMSDPAAPRRRIVLEPSLRARGSTAPPRHR